MLFSSSVAGLVAKAAPAVVSVHSHRARGSGFVWKSGLVVTADEALAEEGEISIARRRNGAASHHRRPRSHHRYCPAAVRCQEIAPARLSPGQPALGSLAIVVAAERGAPAAALGTTSLTGGRWRSLRGGDIDARIELDVRLRHSHQGGLALNAAGEAVGMAVEGARRVIVIPAATIERVAARLETHGRIARGYLGVGLQAVKLDDGVGAMVMSVDKSGPAAAAGIRQGDVIVGWNDEKLSGVRPLLRSLGPDSVGRVVELLVRRGGEPTRLTLTIGERPET